MSDDNGKIGSDAQHSGAGASGKPAYTPYAPDDLPPGYEDTAIYKRLPNGAVFDKRIKRIVANPGGGLSAVKQGVSLKQIYADRVIQAKLAAQGAIKELAIVRDGKKTSVAGWARVVSAQAELALDIDRGRASTDAARFVGQATGFLSSERDNKADSGGPAGQDDTIHLLAGALAGFVHLAGSSGSVSPSNNSDNDSVIDAEWVE